MIRRLVSTSLHQPLIVLMLLGLFIATGVAAFRSLPVEAFPDVTDVQVTVITLFPGHAPEEVEKQVTIPLEIALSGIPNAIRLFSHTQFGLSYVILTFNDNATDYFARQQVLERLQGVDLPPGLQPELAPLSTAIGEIYRYRVRADGWNATELRSVQDWVVSRNLRLIPGVADIVSFGGFIKQYEVTINTDKMKSYNVTLQQVFTALGRGNANAGGSFLEQGEQQYLIRGIGMLRTSDDIGDIVVSAHAGTPLFVKDIAQVNISAVPRQGLVGQDDDDEIVSGIVLMRKGENPSEILKAVKERVETLNASILPKPVRIVPFYDRTKLIDTTLTTVFRNLIEGAALVTIVLFLFLGNVRAAGIVAVIIPLSLLATFIGLRVRGIPANLLSLGAMDFGIIVDGAVIVLENVFRHLSEKREGHHVPKAIILDAAVEVGRPTLFSMLVIILAHLPIFTLQRHEGRIFAPMAYTVVSALIGSLVFSLTLVPLLSLFLLSKQHAEEENLLVRVCKRLYAPVLSFALARRRMVLAIAVAALAATLALVPRLGTEFLPELNEGSIWVNIMLPAGISVTETSKQLKRIRAILRQIPEVTGVVSKAGRPEDGTDPKMINMAEFLVDVKPQDDWRPHLSKDQLIDQMNTSLQAIPGIEPSFSQPIRDNVLESISQIDGQIVIKIFGDDTEMLRRAANDVLRTIATVPGVARAFVDRGGQVPQLQIEIDRGRAARYGLNVADVEDVIETALGGRTATQLWEGERRFNVVVRLGEAERRDSAAISNVLVDTPSGLRIPLSDVATVGVGSGNMNIARESGTRVAAIGVFIQGRDMGGVVSDMQKRVAANVHLPTGYYTAWGGEFENQERAMARLSLIVPISVFLIFVLLFHAFGSVKHAALILMNVPFALIGGILALYLTGIHLSVSAAIGFIALFGQAVLNGVVMVSYFNQLRRTGIGSYEAARQGSLVRLRTVLMTTLLAMLGLTPMALSHSIGSEVQRPLAVVIIGGLFSAAALTLIVLPALYLMFEGRHGRHPAAPVGDHIDDPIGDPIGGAA
jgi:cobalt-zinc-cadmium resistance protein CzcA